MAWPLIIAAAVSAVSTGIGMYQQWKGKKDYEKALKNYQAYDYKTPAAIGEAVNTAKVGYEAGLPTYDLLEKRIGATTSRAVNAAERYAGSGQELMSSAEQTYGKELEMLNALSLQDMQYRDQARGQYIQSLLSQGQMDQRGAEMEYESIFNRWQIGANRASTMSAYGRQGAERGMSDLASTFGSWASMNSNKSELAKMFESADTKASSAELWHKKPFEYQGQETNYESLLRR